MRALLLLLAIAAISGCTAVPAPAGAPAGTVGNVLAASDGARIAYAYLPRSGTKAVVLLHQLGADKNSWTPALAALANQSAVLAIDFRGHGQSTGQADDYGHMLLDAQAGIAFLRAQGYTDIGIIGASIGANVGVNAAAQDPGIKTLVLLSPGLEYRGIAITDSIKEVNAPILLYVDPDDSYAWQSALALINVNARIQMIPVAGAGHGTAMLSSSQGPQIAARIGEWVRDRL